MSQSTPAFDDELTKEHAVALEALARAHRDWRALREYPGRPLSEELLYAWAQDLVLKEKSSDPDVGKVRDVAARYLEAFAELSASCERMKELLDGISRRAAEEQL